MCVLMVCVCVCVCVCACVHGMCVLFCRNDANSNHFLVHCLIYKQCAALTGHKLQVLVYMVANTLSIAHITLVHIQ